MAELESSLPAVGTRPARTALGLVRDRRFGTFIAARLTSSLGVWTFALLATVEMYRLTGSATWVGLVSVVQFGPQVLLSPLAGGMADRGNVRAQVIAGYLLCGLGAFAIVPATIGSGTLAGVSGPVLILVGGGLMGLGFVVGGPAGLAIVPSLVEADELAAAIQVNSLPLMVSRAAGPAIGAGLLAGPGAVTGLVLAGTVNFAAAVVMACIGLPRRLPGGGSADPGILPLVRHLRGHRDLVLTMIGIAVVGAAADPATTLSPVLADRVGADPTYAGWVTSAFGLGALALVPLMGLVRTRVSLFGGASVGLVAMAAGLGVAAAPVQPAPLVAMAIAGAGMTIAYTSLSVLVQVLAPPSMRGRVLALWILAFLGLRPPVALAAGFGADQVGAGPVLCGLAAVVLVVGWRCRVRAAQKLS